MNKIDKWIERIRGVRKWSIMVLIMTVSIAFRIANLINGSEFVDLLKGIGIAFMTSNAIEHAKYFISNKKSSD